DNNALAVSRIMGITHYNINKRLQIMRTQLGFKTTTGLVVEFINQNLINNKPMNKPWHKGPGKISTHSGVLVDITDPQVTDIFPIDIAVGLARECRWHGATKKNYTVADHSVWCAIEAESRYPDDAFLPFKVLLHDAHEYLLKDIPTPLKELLPEYRKLAHRLQDAIHLRFGVVLSAQDKQRIAEIDERALEYEWHNKVTKHTGWELQWQVSADLFLDHFKRLCKHPFVITPNQTAIL
ncbi:MAG: hypothetical protein SFU21_03395, partial [Flavihumibacter sp.]|nr:hypothetical protein [Flavihumibacter sp.]